MGETFLLFVMISKNGLCFLRKTTCHRHMAAGLPKAVPPCRRAPASCTAPRTAVQFSLPWSWGAAACLWRLLWTGRARGCAPLPTAISAAHTPLRLLRILGCGLGPETGLTRSARGAGLRWCKESQGRSNAPALDFCSCWFFWMDARRRLTGSAHKTAGAWRPLRPGWRSPWDSAWWRWCRSSCRFRTHSAPSHSTRRRGPRR